MKEIKYAGFWVRTWATLFDTLLWLVIVSPILAAVYSRNYWVNEYVTPSFWDLVFSVGFFIIATMIFWRYKSATPGKMIFGLKIVDAKTGGKPSSYQFIVRYFAYVFSILPLFLGMIWVGFDNKKQGWHDKLAKTVVIRRDASKDDLKKPNYFRRLVNGDVKLIITFWVFGVLIGILFEFVWGANEHFYAQSMDNFFLSILATALMIFMGICDLYLMIALWRSAGKYDGRRVWAHLARFSVILSILFGIYFIVDETKIEKFSPVAIESEIQLANKDLPMMIDDETRLNHISVIDNDIYYNYTLIGWTSENTDIPVFIKEMTEILIEEDCTDPEWKALLDKGRDFVYIYGGDYGEHFTTITVKALDCAKLQISELVLKPNEN